MYFEPPPQNVVPRRVSCPIDEQAPVVCLNPLYTPPTIDALATFYKRARDTLDYGIDFTAWVKANGDTQLKTVTWASVVDPNVQGAPILSEQVFPGGETWVILGPGAANDIYWIDCTVTVDATQARVGGDAISTVERTLVRRIAIQVLAG